MFYGLSHKQDYFAEALHKAVLLAPCFIAADCPEYDQLMETYARLPDLGIYAMKGPNYKEDRKVVCDNLPFKFCLTFSLYGTPIFQTSGIHNSLHWCFNSYVDRFQEFPENYKDGELVAPLVELGNIDRVPTTFIMGDKDGLCSADLAYRHIPQFGLEPETEIIEGAKHGYFDYP